MLTREKEKPSDFYQTCFGGWVRVGRKWEMSTDYCVFSFWGDKNILKLCLWLHSSEYTKIYIMHTLSIDFTWENLMVYESYPNVATIIKLIFKEENLPYIPLQNY